MCVRQMRAPRQETREEENHDHDQDDQEPRSQEGRGHNAAGQVVAAVEALPPFYAALTWLLLLLDRSIIHKHKRINFRNRSPL